MKLTELELKLLLKIPSTYDNLYASMLFENVGTDERRNQVRMEAFRLRER